MKSLKFFFRKYRYNRKKNLVLGIILLLCSGIGIGYAFISTPLNITGSLNVASSKWDVHFENVNVTNGSVTATTDPTITNDTTISFATILENPGDFYEFTVDIVNDGTYNAKIDSLTVTPILTATQQEFFEYIVKYSDGVDIQKGDTLNSGDTENIKVYLKYKENVDSTKYPGEDIDFDFSVSLNYVQGTGNSIAHIISKYTTNLADSSKPNNNYINTNQAMPSQITFYDTVAAARASFSNRPIYLKHKIENNIVTESYVEFVVTPEMAQANQGMTTGTYAIQGGAGDEGSLAEKPTYEANKAILQSAFGSSNCTAYAYYFICSVPDMYSHTSPGGYVTAGVSDGANCIVDGDGASYCSVP